jgi:hypothetical protein
MVANIKNRQEARLLADIHLAILLSSSCASNAKRHIPTVAIKEGVLIQEGQCWTRKIQAITENNKATKKNQGKYFEKRGIMKT